ncbi:hypothetical protein [Flavobacterium sp. HNIBRBA15423]|uniref:hypothetical protein n=1 Tax=Flavobacterium sp. HNIBRBA15423 TaxID=3458683 RepID=UPI0040440EE2
MKQIIIFISILLFSCSKSNTKSNDETQNTAIIDTLTFSYDGFNNGLLLNLLSNGNFVNESYLYSCFGGGKRKKVFGKYIMDSINLTLIPERVEFIEYPMEMDQRTKTTKVKYGIDSLKIKTNFQLITWEGNRYLLSDSADFNWSLKKENDYMRFSVYINAGLEPKVSGMYLAHKTEDSITTDFDLKQIPKKWQEYFLKKPISAKIKNIKKVIDPNDPENMHWIIEFNKGKKDGIKNGLTLETKEGDFFIEIDSVLMNKSFGQTYLYDYLPKQSIGIELRTKWE